MVAKKLTGAAIRRKEEGGTKRGIGGCVRAWGDRVMQDSGRTRKKSLPATAANLRGIESKAKHSTDLAATRTESSSSTDTRAHIPSTRTRAPRRPLDCARSAPATQSTLHLNTAMSRATRRESGPQAAKGSQAVEDAGEQLHQRFQAALQLHSDERADQKPAVPDICPVCKSSRYLNPNMRFLINPECYHQMCESCVDRIYSHGPAPCRIVGCGKTLRKNRFRKKTFEDIQVEREVDIRRRVAAV